MKLLQRDVDVTTYKFGLFIFTCGLDFLDVCSTSLTIWKSRNGKHEDKKINESYKIGGGDIHDIFKNEMSLLTKS
jgi:hypothetical protein